MSTFKPDTDGVNHINVYSHGRTDVGRMLTNFAETTFKHPQFGYFASIEGLWYYIKTGMVDEELRRLYGHSAKAKGIRSIPVMMDEEEFRRIIKEGIRAKIQQTPVLYKFFIASELPFTHYYVFGSKIVNVPKHQWQIDFLEELRREFKSAHSNREHVEQDTI